MKYLLFAFALFVGFNQSGLGFDTFEGNQECTMSCEVSSDEFSYGSSKKWYCVAKDSCGKSYLPECGATCKSHAETEAIKICAEGSDDPETCEVIDADEACSKDRAALLKLIEDK